MKLLNAILEAAKEMDPSRVSASDVSTYVRHVKSALKGQKMSKSAIASAVRDIAEDDPKFGAHPAALPKLIAAVAAKLTAPAPVKESLDEDDDEKEHTQAAKFSASTPKAELQKQKKYLEDQIKDASDRFLQLKLKQALKKINGFLNESWDNDDDEDADVKAADDEARKRKIKLMSPRAEKALSKKLSNADKKDEDKGSKKVDESAHLSESIDVDELSMPDIESAFRKAIKAKYPDAKSYKLRIDGKEMRAEDGDKCLGTLCMNSGKIDYLGESTISEGWDSEDDEDADVKAADDEARKRNIKLMSPRAEKALSKKLAKADKRDESKPSKVDESVEEAPVQAAPKKMSFIESLKAATQSAE